MISADAAFDSECFDKLLSGDRDATEKLHSEKPRAFESLRAASELCRVLKRQVADAFFGTSLVPSFEFQGGSPSAVTEARRSVSRRLFRCCHVMIGAAVATHLSGFPLIYRYAPLPSDEQLLPFLRSGIGESVQPLPLRLMELYYTSDTGVHAKTRYVLAYRAAVAEDISTVPVYNSLYELPAFAPVESPCEDYAGLCMIRILKAWMDGDCELAHTIAAEAVMAYRRGNARRRRAEARLFDITMAEYVSNLPYPAEGIISGLTDGELVITLVNGGVGYLRLEEFGLTDIDLSACLWFGMVRSLTSDRISRCGWTASVLIRARLISCRTDELFPVEHFPERGYNAQQDQTMFRRCTHGGALRVVRRLLRRRD